MKQWLLMPALLLALAAQVHAAPPPIEAEPNKDYPIAPQAGEWVIVCANYKGPDAADLARQLVYQLRSRDHQAAYVLNFSEKQRTQMKAEEERWKQEHPQLPFKHWKIEEEYGVFIGGFADMEIARNYMNTVVKKLKLPILTLPGGKPPYDEALMQVEEGPNHHMVMKHVPLNPLASSFVSRNPTLAATQKKADPFLKVLNEQEEYNLLTCKQPFTLAVQEYAGGSVIMNQVEEHSSTGGFLDKLRAVTPWGGTDKHLGEALNAAALQAHETARVLRKLKFEAYVLHTRNSSIVTIGGFQGVNDPAMLRTVEQLASLKLDALRLFKVPMEIPRP